jgi:hypothetical protein
MYIMNALKKLIFLGLIISLLAGGIFCLFSVIDANHSHHASTHASSQPLAQHVNHVKDLSTTLLDTFAVIFFALISLLFILTLGDSSKIEVVRKFFVYPVEEGHYKPREIFSWLSLFVRSPNSFVVA